MTHTFKHKTTENICDLYYNSAKSVNRQKTAVYSAYDFIKAHWKSVQIECKNEQGSIFRVIIPKQS